METLTPIPQSTINDNHGIYVAAYNLTKPAAVNENTGAKYAQINGSE